MNDGPSGSMPVAEASPARPAYPDLHATRNRRYWRAFAIQWLLLGLALSILGGVLASHLYEDRQFLESVAQDRLSNGARLIAETVESRLTAIDRALVEFRVNLPFARAQAESETLVSLYVHALQNGLEGVRTVMMIDAQGTVTASGRAQFVGDSVRNREYFQATLNNPDEELLFVPAPFKAALGSDSLNVFRTLSDREGKFAGIISASLDLEYFRSVLQSLRATPDVAAGLVHGSGKVLLSTSSPAIESGQDVSAADSFFSLHLQNGRKESVFRGTTSFLPNERLAAAHTIKPRVLPMTAPLVAVVSQEMASILAPWRVDLRNQIVFFALLSIASALSLLAYQRRTKHAAQRDLRYRIERQKDSDRLRLATEASGTGIWELDLLTNRLTWNDTMFQLFGKQKADFAPHYDAWKACVLPEDLHATEAALRQAIDHAGVFNALFRIRRGDGEIRTISAHAWIYADPTGRPAYATGVNRDITEQQQTEQALRAGKQFIDDVLDSLVQHIAVLDAQGVIVSVNRAWQDFAHDNGASGGTAKSVGLSYLDICSAATAYPFGSEAPAVLAGIRAVLAGTRSEFGLEYPCHAPGEERWFVMHVTRLRGAFSGAVVAHENITARKLAENAVRQSEARFSAFFEQAMVGMCTSSPDKRVLTANPALCALTGYSLEQLRSKTWAEMTHPDDLASELVEFERLLRGETDRYALEKRFFRADGGLVDVALSVSAVRRDDGSIDFWAAIIDDISERKLAEQQRLKSMVITQQFLEHLPGVAFVKDENLRIAMANQAFGTLLGMSPKTMLGKSSQDLFPGEFGRKLDADDRRVLEHGSVVTIDEHFDGRAFETTKFIIEGDAENRLLAGISVDITERRKYIERQDAQLQISEIGGSLPEKEFLGQGLEMVERLTGSQIGFIHLVNKDQETIELVTWTPGALKGCTAVHAYHYPMRQAGIWADCARNKAISVFNDYPAYLAKRGLPDGHAPLQRLLCVPVIENNRVQLIIGVGNKASDYTDDDCMSAQLIGNDLWRIVRRMRAEVLLKEKVSELTDVNARLDDTNNKLLQSEKLAGLGQLAAGVAHEINNPIGYVSSNLNSLSAYVSDLLAIDAAYADIEAQLGVELPQAFARTRQLKTEFDHPFMVSDIKHLLGESREGLERVRKIVQDLKDFSRVGEAGWKWVNLHDGLESTLNIVWNEIKYKAEVDRDYGDLPEINCIPSQINQVFMNLLTNAAQSIAEHGRIVLRSGCGEGEVWIEVQDNGAGIAPENIEHVFEPFYTTKPIGKGTGLGLSLCWGIIQRHHGEIRVNSVVGEGTTFRVILPIAPANVENGAEAES